MFSTYSFLFCINNIKEEKIMEKEIWKDIKGYEGKYQVSNLGRVKSLNYHRSGKERILKNLINTRGYLMENKI